jgi:DNA helicase HerA-like ATPase
MGRLEQPGGVLPHLRLKAKIEGLLADGRFAFMFGGDVVEDCLAETMSRLLRLPVAGRPVTIVDLSGVPTEIVNVVVSLIVRMIFDFALWSRDPHASPSLLVCEEAHRYVNRDQAVGFVPARRAITRIALEGRKYGVSLCLVSQRPSELAPSTLAQCNTIFALRMSNELDRQFVRDALPEGAGGLAAALPALRTGEALVVGEAVPVPIRLQLADLDEARRPRSATAPFSQAWRREGVDDGVVRDTVDRWRRQRRDV